MTDASFRIKLTLSYDGTPYHGWQVQKNAPSVQSTLQAALEQVAGELLPVTGCSRTDAGVHAVEYVCHTQGLTVPVEKLPLALNAHLPSSIAVYRAERVSPDFHARYDCHGKEYVYKIFNRRCRDPFSVGRALFYPEPIPVDSLAFVGKELEGEHDFRAFMAQGSKITDTRRRIYRCRLSREGDYVLLRVAADGFLYNMVRIIAGTYLAAAQGKYRPGDITRILASGQRRLAGSTAPAWGLYLNRVYYGDPEQAPLFFSE